ncbi:MAG: IS110 family transposase [Burkholderiales bacterium]|nr:MAG: IS110 family transposase [Betaproteobacteria bacterium]TAG24656.1 MAG: IS110 family transposase [Burkholderiales bacterium]
MENPTPTQPSRPNTLGIDVSKAKLDCALLRQSTPGKRLDKSVANTPAGVNALLAWLDSKGAPAATTRVALEPTGVYHETATWLLHEAGCTVVLVNPARLRSYAGAIGVASKNDQIDAALLARYGATEPLSPWQPPSEAARTLSALLARRDTLCADIQRDQNRLEKAQCAMSTPKVVVNSINKTLKFLEKELTALDAQIKRHIDDDPTLKHNDTLLKSIKGVGPRVAQRMNALLSSKSFKSAEAVAAYIGLNPVQHLSGSSVRGRSTLSKRGPSELRKLLYLPAVTATTCNPHVKAIYQRMIARGACKMSALGAAMRKLAHLCFGVIHSGKPYDPTWHPDAKRAQHAVCV